MKDNKEALEALLNEIAELDYAPQLQSSINELNELKEKVYQSLQPKPITADEIENDVYVYLLGIGKLSDSQTISASNNEITIKGKHIGRVRLIATLNSKGLCIHMRLPIKLAHKITTFFM